MASISLHLTAAQVAAARQSMGDAAAAAALEKTGDADFAAMARANATLAFDAAIEVVQRAAAGRVQDAYTAIRSAAYHGENASWMSAGFMSGHKDADGGAQKLHPGARRFAA